MAGVSLPIWVSFLTAAGGYFGSLGTEAFRDRRQRIQRDDDRKAALQEKRDNFQLNSLLDAQDVLADFARTVFQASLADRLAHRDTGEWGTQQLPKEISETEWALQVRLRKLASRLQDTEARTLLERILSESSSAGMAPSPEQHMHHLTQFMTTVDRANAYLGRLIRGHESTSR